MRPEFRPRRLCGRGPVAKRVPTVQGRRQDRGRSLALATAQKRTGPKLRNVSRAQHSTSQGAFTRVFDALRRSDALQTWDRHGPWRSRISGAPLHSFRAAPRPGHVTARPFHSRAPGSTKGKPPGGDPAAPVRRRSCRGAGSATAGARLGYMVITGVVRQGVPCPACPYRIGAGPSGAFHRRRVLRGRGTRRDQARSSD
jgi:hypothetical protein